MAEGNRTTCSNVHANNTYQGVGRRISVLQLPCPGQLVANAGGQIWGVSRDSRDGRIKQSSSKHRLLSSHGAGY